MGVEVTTTGDNWGSPMRSENFGWPFSSILLGLSGNILIAVGCYFLFLRPALLPEDVRYMNLSSAELQSLGPRLASWLTHVFRVMGGYVMATGVLALTLALTAFRQRSAWALAGAIVAGLASIGWMSAVNFMINSDFKWVLFGFALIWAASIAAFAVEARRADTSGSVGDVRKGSKAAVALSWMNVRFAPNSRHDVSMRPSVTGQRRSALSGDGFRSTLRSGHVAAVCQPTV